MNIDNIILEVNLARRRISELESRIKRPKDWTSGEISIFKMQIIEETKKLSRLTTDLENDLHNKKA